MEKRVFEYQDGQFIALVHEVFGSTIEDLGFEFHEENIKLLRARRGDIQIVFRLESGYRYRLFSLEIELLGELGERTASQPYYRLAGVSGIAKYFNPEHTISSEIPVTEEDLRKEMEIQKSELLTYCKDILNGDVVQWQRMVDLMTKDGGWQPD